MKYVNVCVGYYPANTIDSTGMAPGCLVLNDKGTGVSKAYDITLNQLEKGLYATYRIEDEPGTYVLGTKIYVTRVGDDGSVEVMSDCTYSSDRNCTSVCLGVMSEMGLPSLSASTQWNGSEGPFSITYEGNSPFKLAENIQDEK